MIDIVDHVVNSLSNVGVPVVFQSYPPGAQLPAQYITFLEYSTSPELEAADQEIETERLIQMNVWSRDNYHSLVKKVREQMEAAGFYRTAEYDAPYTDGDSHFNKVMRFAFYDDYK